MEESGISRWHDQGSFHHENDGAIRSARPVDDAFGHHVALPRLKVGGLGLQINDQVPIENEEKLIVVLMLVPVVLTLHDSEADYGVVHLA